MAVTGEFDEQEAAFEDATERGRVIYERLKPTLEPAQDGKAIAIHVDSGHVDSGEYAVADSLPEARRQMHERRPDGMLYSRTIGVERDMMLVQRILAGAKR